MALSPQNAWLRWFPYALIVLVFALRISAFNLYRDFPSGAAFETAIGRLNIDAKGVGTCAGDFPRHFIEQSRCGYYYLSRPGYFAVVYAASRPIVWGAALLPDSAWAKIPVERELFPYAVSVVVAVFLNLALGFLTVLGIKRLFAPYLKPELVWLAQVLYASAYGTSAHMADGIAEVFQHLMMVWVPLLFRDMRSPVRGITLGFAATGKEVICCFAGGVITAWKEKKLSWDLLFIPVPLLCWFAFLRIGHGVEIKSYSVSDWDYGTWYLTAFRDFPLFLQKCEKVFVPFFRFLLPTFIPFLWIGLIAYPLRFRAIPFLIHAQLLMAAGQMFAMGYIHPRVMYNFLFLPLLFAAVLGINWALSLLKGDSGRQTAVFGLGAAAVGILCVCLVYGIY